MRQIRDAARAARRAAMAGLALAGLAGAGTAQQAPAGTGVVTGRVLSASTRQPVEGATVLLRGTALRAVTTGDGRFALAGTPVGVFAVEARAIGFTPLVRSDVVIGSGKPVSLELLLEPSPFTLAELEVAVATFFAPPAEAPPSAQIVGREEIRRAPGVQEDVVRAVSLLPGVGVTIGGRNDLVVRGGAPFENLFVVDGLEVPNINHFGSQGSTGGPLALVNIEFVQQAEFGAAAIDARYGDRTASVTKIGLREGTDRRLAGQLNLSATGAGVLLEGPVGRDGSFYLNARRSYLDLIFELADFGFVPSYWDFSGKVVQRLGERHTLSLFGIGAIDDFEYNNATADDLFDNSRIPSLTQRQYFAGLAWRMSGRRSLLDVTLGRTWTRFETFQNDTLGTPIFRNFSTEGDNSLRTDFTHAVSPALSVTVGNTARLAGGLDYEIILPGDLRRDAQGVPRPLVVDTTFSAFRNATYASARWQATSRLALTAGLRGDWYGQLGEYRVAPRLVASLGVGPRDGVSLALARTWQAPSFIWLTGDAANPALTPFGADQVVLGWNRLLRPDLKIQLEAYAKRYRDYPAREFRPQAVLAPSGFEDVTNDIPFGLEPLEAAGDGRAIGAELFVQKKLSEVPVYGLASLTVARSEFRALDGAWRPGAYDGRFIGTVAAGWRPNAAWELSGKFRLATGLPSTPFVTSGELAGTLDFTQYNAGPRLPTFHQLDVRVDRRWSFSGSQLALYLDVQNVYGRKNVSQYQWNARLGAPEPNETLGVFPTIGVTWEF